MRVCFKNFTGGEISSTLHARYDLAKYQNSMQRMENFFPNTHSNAVRRSGMRYIATLGGQAVLFPFIFSTEEENNFVLAFKDYQFSVYNENGLVAENITSPFGYNDLYKLSFAQVGDVIYFAHKNYPLHKLTRTGEYPYTWGIEEVAINKSLPAPLAPTCTWNETPPALGQTYPPRNYKLRYKIITVDKDGVQSIGSNVGEVTGRYPTEWVVGDYVNLSWNAVTGAEEYNIYRESAGYYGYIGTVKNGEATGGTVNGIYYNDVLLPVLKYIGTRTRTVITYKLNGRILQDTSSTNIPISAGNNNAFYDAKTQTLFVYITVTVNWYYHFELYPWWTPKPGELYRTTKEYYWAVIYNVPETILGTYSNFAVGKKISNSVSVYPQNLSSIVVTPSFINAGTITFRDNNYEPDINDTPQEDWFPFDNGNNPCTVGFHQQRMVLAGTKDSPQTVYMSRTGDFENFRKSRPLQDDDPIEYTLASSSIDDIQWIASFKDLLIGTSGAEYNAMGSDGTGSAITPKGINIMPQSFWGSTNLFPIVIGTSVLHAQRFGSKVRDLFYSLESDGYNGTDLTTLVPHFFDGYTILQWAYQQTPDNILWCVRNDGVLIAMSYDKEQQIVGWTKHTTDGTVKSVCRVSGDRDKVFFVVERESAGETIYTLEMLEQNFTQLQKIEDAFFVDSGVTLKSDTPKTEWDYPIHLKGKKVILLVDGSPVTDFEMLNDTKFTIPYPAKTVTIGLPYTSILAPLPVNSDTQSGSTMGLKRGYGKCSVNLYRSVNGKYGTDLENLYEFPFIPDNYGEAVTPFTGNIDFIPSGGQNEDTTVYLVQDAPLPMQVMSIVVDVDFAQQG